jgi:iron complex transport system substrate-binding protein
MKSLMKSVAVAVLVAFVSSPSLAFDSRSITDATGRSVMVPIDPARVFAAGPPAATLLYTIKPSSMVGWVRAPRKMDLPYLQEGVRNLPELGRLTGKGDTLNLEILLSAKPELIVDYGTINDTYADLAARVQDQTNLPYVLFDGSFSTLSTSIRQMADVLAVPQRGEELAAYVDTTLAKIDALLEKLPAPKRPNVYLARGPEGIESPARGSINAEIIERVGATNVVVAETSGLVTVTPEQVQAWAPDVIITIDKSFAENVGKMAEWQGVPAVDNGRVYLAPSAPFGFIDSPPSVNRMAGLIWLTHKLYGDEVDGDLKAEIADFYDLFYGVRPSDDALATLIGE